MQTGRKIPKYVRCLLVESLTFPDIRYCLAVWGNCTSVQRQRAQKAINFGVRIVTGLGRREHATPSLREFGWADIVLVHVHALFTAAAITSYFFYGVLACVRS